MSLTLQILLIIFTVLFFIILVKNVKKVPYILITTDNKEEFQYQNNFKNIKYENKYQYYSNPIRRNHSLLCKLRFF